MPPKGKKHLSYADVQDRKKELDEKLKKWVKDMDDAQQDAHPQAVAQLRSNADKASLLSGIGYLLRAGCSDAVARADWKAA